MKRILRRLLLPLALMCSVLPLRADDGVVVDPGIERGISPGKAYQVGDVDTVNLFNGNLSAVVSLGNAYPVGGSLSYSLALHYAGDAWEPGERIEEVRNPISGEIETHVYTWAFPTRRSNAGHGWILSLGNIFVPQGSIWPAYEAPDGGIHSLHPPDPTVPSSTYYSKDGTYLRLTTSSTTYTLEFPDGTVQTYDAVLYPGGGLASTTLRRIADRSGNTVDITYDDGTAPPLTGTTVTHTWHIHDSTGRDQYVYFKSGPAYDETSSSVAVGHDIVAEVHLTAFGGKTLVYRLSYPGDTTPDPWPTLKRPCVNNPDPNATSTTAAPLLDRIDAFDATSTSTPLLSYKFTYRTDDGSLCLPSMVSGSLSSMRLPTGGTIAWTYAQGGLAPAGALYSGAAVLSRKVTGANGDTLSIMDYDYVVNQTGFADHGVTKVTTKNSESDPVVMEETNFTICPNPQLGTFHNSLENGLPISRFTDDGGGRFLSTRTYAFDGGAPTLKRETYLRYEADTTNLSATGGDWNRRVASSSTITYHDYDSNKDVATTDYSNYDGLGHYRAAVTSGNFSQGNTAGSFTNFNPAAGTFVPNTSGTGTGFTLPSTSSPWILNTYPYQATSSTSGAGVARTAMTQFAFDTNGRLARRRVLRSDAPGWASTPPPATAPPLSTSDLLTVFAYDTHGNPVTESYYGGDVANNLSTSTAVSLDSLTLPASSEYSMSHTYSSGALESSTYVDSGSPMTFKSVDRTIDPGTGLPAKQREAATGTSDPGLESRFDFDALGRVTTVKRPGAAAWTQYVYTLPAVGSTTTSPRVDQYDDANGVLNQSPAMAHTFMEFDGLGRTFREGRDLPGTQGTTIRLTAYNSAGWKTRQTEWSISPSLATTWQYVDGSGHRDAFGRPMIVTMPNGDAVTYKYTGVSAREKTVQVATGGGPGAPVTQAATTKETYDRSGHVVQVREPSGTITTYDYDEGGRLTDVCMDFTSTCGQTRNFTYDRAGLLNSEQHPEKGTAGNGTTTYVSYDSRGHLRRQYDGSPNGPFDVSFDFDAAERLKKVWLTGTNRTLKEFIYGTTNDASSGDYRNGKLTRAVRHNWFDTWQPPGASQTSVANIQVAETYVYAGVGGAVSARTTKEYDCVVSETETCVAAKLDTDAETRQFSQAFTYDARGMVASLTYPSCLTGCGTLPAAPVVGFVYDHGFLKEIDAFGGVNALTYGDDGALSEVTHANGVVDDIVMERGMGRPSVMTTSHAVDTSSCTAPSVTVQPVGGMLQSAGPSTLTGTVTGDSNQSLHPLSIQWYQGLAGDTTNPVSGGTFTPSGSGGTTSLSLSSVTTTTSYWFKVTNDCGSANSLAATITVCSPADAPVITVEPADASVTSGSIATLSVSASGSSLSYQWYDGGTGQPISGQTGSSYTTGALTASASYFVIVSTPCGSRQSRTAAISIACPVVSLPSALTADADTAVTLRAQTTGRSDHFTWYAGVSPDKSHPIPGCQDSSLCQITAPAANLTATYWVMVPASSPCPESDSGTITITGFCQPPQITASTPPTQVVAVNEYIALWTMTTGTNVQAHWYKGAVGDTSVPVTTTTFPATLGSAGDYWVNVTGGCGSAVTATAHIDVCTSPVVTSVSTDTQIASGSTTTLSVTATGTNLTYSWVRINADATETQVGTSASYTTDPLTAATQYYVVVMSQGHCPAPRAYVTVSVCSPPQFTTAPPVVYANSGPVGLSATVDDPNTTVTWYATDPRLPGGATVITSPVYPTTQTTYWAQAKDGVCLSGVTTETVVICTPQFTSVTPSQTITAGDQITLAATATGPSVSYKWWTGTTTPTTQIGSASSITVNPTTDTDYWAEAQCSCPITTYPLRQQVTITVCHPATVIGPQATQNVTVGDWVVLTATATGTNVQVHWYKGAVGDKSMPITVSNGGFYAAANDGGTYWVEATATCGAPATASTIVDVCVPPVITTQPVGTQIQSGSPTTLTVAATGSTLTYDWYVVNADNTQTLAGSGTSFNTGVLSADTKYVAHVTSKARCYTSSNQVTVSVCTTPQITYLTPSQTVGMQQPVTLYVAASGTSMQYEWKNLSTNQVVATTYSVDVAPSATTSYSVRVYSGICSVTSATVTLTVCGPTITQQPASKTIAYGSSTTLTVAAVGDGTISAQWYRGSLLDTSSPVGTGLTLTVQPAGSTQYWVRVSTPCRSVDSAPALVTVSGCTQPVISAQSGNTTIASDQSVTLSVTAQNTWDMHYQWYLWDASSSAWSAISGATSTTYVESPTTVSNTYMVSLWNSCGLSTNSSSMAITRTPACYPAAITSQPQSVTYNAGSSVTFTVAATGTNVHYQWVAADPTGSTFVPVSGQTSATLTVTPQSQSASYYVIATASCGAAAVSNTVTATRNCTPPAISSQTQSQTIRKNTWVTLQATATGTATIAYTWYASTTGSNFTQIGTGSAIAAQPQVTTYYYVAASNSCGSVTGSYITITVTQCAPTISTHPASQTINSTQNVTLSVVAASDQLHYQWYISTGGSYTAISGATAATLTYSPTGTSYFYVNVYNDCGSVNSNTATVTVTPACYAPTVSLSVPSSGQFDADGTAMITASYTGTNPTFTYYRTPPNGSNPVVVAGPTTATTVQVPQGVGYTYYYFYVVATNSCGTATSSHQAIGVYNP